MKQIDICRDLLGVIEQVFSVFFFFFVKEIIVRTEVGVSHV